MYRASIMQQHWGKGGSPSCVTPEWYHSLQLRAHVCTAAFLFFVICFPIRLFVCYNVIAWFLSGSQATYTANPSRTQQTVVTNHRTPTSSINNTPPGVGPTNDRPTGNGSGTPAPPITKAAQKGGASCGLDCSVLLRLQLLIVVFLLCWWIRGRWMCFIAYWDCTYIPQLRSRYYG